MASAMKKLHCEHLRFTVDFDQKHFKTKDFRDAIKANDKSSNSFALDFSSKKKTRKEHAHLYVFLAGENSNFQLSYATGENEEPDNAGPYLEDLTQWFAKFFTRSELRCHVFAAYEFGRTYESAVQLDYPVTVSGRTLTGARIVGHSIDFPDEAMIHKATISKRDEGGIQVFLYASVQLNFSDLDVAWVIEHLSEYPSDLVRKKGEKDATK